MKLLLFITILLSGASTPLSAQDLGDPGPHSVGWRDIDFRDSHYGRGRVYGRIYYPAVLAGRDATADTTSGPFPLTGFMHGWIEPASDYDRLCTHLASWGFVVMSNDTETALLFVKMQRQAKDTRALMQWVEDESQNTTSWLYGMTDNLPWSACGHSMGGGALSYLVKEEPRIESIVMLSPYQGTLLGNTQNGFSTFDDYSGSALVVTGDEDLTNNWNSIVRPWYNKAENSNRKVWALIHGGDHFGSTDSDVHLLWGFGSLSYDSQHLAYRRLASSFLLAEIMGQEDTYYELEQTLHIDLEGEASEPPLWAKVDPADATQILLGSLAQPQWRLRIAGSSGTGSMSTAFGNLGLNQSHMQVVHDVSVGALGFESLQLPVQASWSGLTLYFQALANTGNVGALSSVNSVVIP